MRWPGWVSIYSTLKLIKHTSRPTDGLALGIKKNCSNSNFHSALEKVGSPLSAPALLAPHAPPAS
jgi:hypothetical protein